MEVYKLSEPARSESGQALNRTRTTICPGRSTRTLAWALVTTLSMCVCLAQDLRAEPAPARPQGLQPIPWLQRTLFIPYQPNKEAPAAPQIAQVQLLMSRTGTSDWVELQSAEPNVQGFNYHAPEDGEYWFALRHLDSNGQALDGATVAPQLHLVINTQPVPPPASVPAVPAKTESTAELTSPTGSVNPFQTAATLAQDWPVNNRIPSASENMIPANEAPPISNPYATANEANTRRTPAMFAVDGSGKSKSESKSDIASSKLNNDPESTNAPTQLPSASDSDWSSSGPQSGPMLVNARTFDVEYDLQAVGSWGVAKVELWGTQDEGATWQSFGIDSDNVSPIRVAVPNSGTYGFRILVEGTNSIGVQPPQTGDKPEMVVVVDLDPPKAEVTALESGAGNAADQLCIRWSADDRNLELRPISLYYSSYAEGPWSTIAAGLENTGSYVWRIERHIPGRFFLKLEARDTAGNVAVYQSPEPIELNRPQPTGTLRNVRPVSDPPTAGQD